MHEGLVQEVGQTCRVCSYGPVNPRRESTVDRFTGETVVEALWICPRCGSRFAAGIVERIPKSNEKK